MIDGFAWSIGSAATIYTSDSNLSGVVPHLCPADQWQLLAKSWPRRLLPYRLKARALLLAGNKQIQCSAIRTVISICSYYEIKILILLDGDFLKKESTSFTIPEYPFC